MNILRSAFPREVYVTAYARTPIGSFLGSLASLSAAKLGGLAISNAIRRSHLEPHEVERVIVGQVLSGGAGQAPQRQAMLHAGIPTSVDVFAVNKVCSSGMLAAALGAQSIALKECDIAVACGMESMSQAPYFLSHARQGYKYGTSELVDMVLHDGLMDPYNQIHMGQCTEKVIAEHGISKTDQDAYAVESYKRAANAWKNGLLEKETFPVSIPTGKKSASKEPIKAVIEDEEYLKLNLEKVATIKAAFQKDGTITAANASKLSDGAAAVVLMSGEKVKELGIKPLAKVLSYADAAVEPIDFSIAPFHAVKKALKRANVSSEGVDCNPTNVHISKCGADFYEINEAFSAVALLNMKLLGLDASNVNLHGGAVSLGHPIGMSGLRIVMSLINVLKAQNGNVGCAAICNGGGGGSAMVLQSV